MSRSSVKRKVERWEAYVPPREWVAYLECGHRSRSEYDDCQLSDEDKERIEKAGGVECYECGDEKERIAALEEELRALKKKATRT